ncbi:MAG: hypothetical protein NC097_00055 [Clostridium sp.]|nr:hypothetical protein [Clostridium sp.]
MKYAFWPIISLFTAVVALTVIGIFVDLRWLIVGLALLFLVAPMLMAFLYIFYALRPFTAYNILPHTIASHPEGLLLTIRRTFPQEENEKKKGEEKGKAKEEEKREAREETIEIVIPEEKITRTEYWGTTKILHIGSKAKEGLLFWKGDMQSPGSSLPSSVVNSR